MLGTHHLLDALRLADCFRELPEDVRAELAGSMSLVTLAPGAVLIEQGRMNHHLHVVLSGELEMEAVSPRGVVRRMAGRQPYQVLGVASVLLEAPAAATARACGPVTLAALSRESVVRFGERSPVGMFVFMEALRPYLQRHRLRVALHTSPAFADLSAAALDELEAALEFVPLYGGEVLLREGDTCEDMFIVLSGRLRVQTTASDGTTATIAELGAGETVGEMALVTGDPRVASVYAVRDSQLARLSKSDFNRLLERHPRTTFDLVTRRLVSRLRVETARLPRHHALSTVAVVPAAPDVPLRTVSERLAAGLRRLGSTLHVWSSMVDAQLGAAGIAQSFDRDHHGGHLVEWLAQQEMEHRFVLYESDARLTPWTERCIRQADHVVVVADAAGDPAVGEIESELLYGTRRPIPRRTLVLVHDSGATSPSGTARWLEQRTVTRHVHVRSNAPADFERLARHVTGNVIGLALGGGFARGLAHLGVFRALADAGVAVDVVGGSSMGALIAAQWAMGWTADEIANRTARGFGASFDDMTLPFLALKRGGKHSRLIRSFFGEMQIEDLWLPYFAVSSNLNRSSLVVHTSGSLADAVTASTRAPGLFPPVVIDSELHVDGGVINNVPVDVMREFTDGGIVIGADVSPPHELGEVDNYGHDVSGWRAAWQRFNPLRRSRGYLPDIVLVLLRVVEFGGISYRREKAGIADLYIAPDVLRFKRNDFGRSRELVDAGYAAAQEALRRWLSEADEAYRVRRPDLFSGTGRS